MKKESTKNKSNQYLISVLKPEENFLQGTLKFF